MKDLRLQAIAIDLSKRFSVDKIAAHRPRLMMLPVVLATKSLVPLGWPLSDAGRAALALGVNSAICYGLYICLVNHAGPVFGSQTGNVVALSGVISGIIIFGDRHSFWIWVSLATMMAAWLSSRLVRKKLSVA
jgi:drug/metabolite transporter (DMT)-like permease